MVGLFRLGQEEMHMLGQDHISDDDNSVADSRLFEDAQEEVATLRRAQQRTPLVTTAGDEVKISGAVGAARRAGMQRLYVDGTAKSCDEAPAPFVKNSHPCKKRKGGAAAAKGGPAPRRAPDENEVSKSLGAVPPDLICC